MVAVCIALIAQVALEMRMTVMSMGSATEATMAAVRSAAVAMVVDLTAVAAWVAEVKAEAELAAVA